MPCAFKNFIIDRTSQTAGAGIRASIFNHYNDVTEKSWEVPLVHSSCDVITLSSTRSHNAINGLIAVGQVVLLALKCEASIVCDIPKSVEDTFYIIYKKTRR